VLEEALAECAPAPAFAYRCLGLELDLVYAHIQLARMDEAWEHAEHAWRSGRAMNELARDDAALGYLAQLSRLRVDASLSRPYLQEYLEQNRGNAEKALYVHENLVHLALHALRFDEARAEIDQALATRLPLSMVGALTLSDVARQRPSRSDEDALNQALAS